MLFKQSILDGIAAGTVTLAFRRWSRAAIKAGGVLRTPVGVLRFDSVEPVTCAALTAKDARLAGFEDADALRRVLGPEDGRPVFRIAFARVGDDPRRALREDGRLDPATIARLQQRLRRYDAAAEQPWTVRALQAIAASPGVRAGDLARRLRIDKDRFKINVRKLKELGLTESLEVGYRLSPRGKAFLDKAERHR